MFPIESWLIWEDFAVYELHVLILGQDLEYAQFMPVFKLLLEIAEFGVLWSEEIGR